jgi:hypothetical protein
MAIRFPFDALSFVIVFYSHFSALFLIRQAKGRRRLKSIAKHNYPPSAAHSTFVFFQYIPSLKSKPWMLILSFRLRYSLRRPLSVLSDNIHCPPPHGASVRRLVFTPRHSHFSSAECQRTRVPPRRMCTKSGLQRTEVSSASLLILSCAGYSLGLELRDATGCRRTGTRAYLAREIHRRRRARGRRGPVDNV